MSRKANHCNAFYRMWAFSTHNWLKLTSTNCPHESCKMQTDRQRGVARLVWWGGHNKWHISHVWNVSSSSGVTRTGSGLQRRAFNYQHVGLIKMFCRKAISCVKGRPCCWLAVSLCWPLLVTCAGQASCCSPAPASAPAWTLALAVASTRLHNLHTVTHRSHFYTPLYTTQWHAVSWGNLLFFIATRAIGGLFFSI